MNILDFIFMILEAACVPFGLIGFIFLVWGLGEFYRNTHWKFTAQKGVSYAQQLMTGNVILGLVMLLPFIIVCIVHCFK